MLLSRTKSMLHSLLLSPSKSWIWYFLTLQPILSTDSSAAVESVFLYKLVPELKDLSNESFYSYKGSLTTPPCYQSVNWIVLKKPVFIGTNVVRTQFFFFLGGGGSWRLTFAFIPRHLFFRYQAA